MALSEQEQRLLDAMERDLYGHDADVMSPGEGSPNFSMRSLVMIVIAVAVGLGIVIGALALKMWWLGIVGFAIIVAGIWIAVSGRGAGRAASATDAPSASPASRPTSAPRATKTSFMDRMEDRWDRRSDHRD